MFKAPYPEQYKGRPHVSPWPGVVACSCVLPSTLQLGAGCALHSIISHSEHAVSAYDARVTRARSNLRVLCKDTQTLWVAELHQGSAAVRCVLTCHIHTCVLIFGGLQPWPCVLYPLDCRPLACSAKGVGAPPCPTHSQQQKWAAQGQRYASLRCLCSSSRYHAILNAERLRVQPSAVKDHVDEDLHEEEADEFHADDDVEVLNPPLRDPFEKPRRPSRYSISAEGIMVFDVDNCVSVDADDMDAVNNISSGYNIVKKREAAEMRKRRTSIGDFFSREKPSPDSAKGRRMSLAVSGSKERSPSGQGFW